MEVSGKDLPGSRDHPGGWLRGRAAAEWKAVVRLVGLWPILLILGCGVFRFVGEASPLTACALFVPWQAWLLPLAPLALALALRRGWLRLGVLAVFLGAAFWFVMDWRPPRAGMAAGDSGEARRIVTILTNNGGDRGFAGIPEIALGRRVDFVALQEAQRTPDDFASAFPGYACHREDEFILLSRWPLVESSTVYLDRGDRRLPCAGRFVVRFADRQLALYVVHLPTPRFFFEDAMRHPRLLLGLGDRRLSPHAGFWREKSAMTRELAALLSSERLPALVVGDFNMTPGGRLLPQFLKKSGLRDLHPAVGSGLGMTFPHDRESWLRALQPWVRIDYILASKDWQPLGLATLRATNDPRQHLPVLARLALPSLGDIAPAHAAAGTP